MAKKVSLLERYSIPLSHLDFDYIKECHDAREIERIVQILRSGEEGHYPDLTKCAEDKLRLLKPESRHFRVEEPLNKNHGDSETKRFNKATESLKCNDRELVSLRKKLKGNENNALDLPPVRAAGKINGEQQKAAQEKDKEKQIESSPPAKRIKSTDYNKWEQYDPDVEILRMDLAEERVKEEVERKNVINNWKNKISPPVNKIIEEAGPPEDPHAYLSELEREKLSEDIRMRGNDYFRSKEYEKAIWEYSQSIVLHPKVATKSLNNRAICHIKLKKYASAIEDCEQCIKADPSNLKAWLRYAQACSGHGRMNDAYCLYERVLLLEPSNVVAQKGIELLRNRVVNLPPPTATRLAIQQQDGPSTSAQAALLPHKPRMRHVSKHHRTSVTPILSSETQTPTPTPIPPRQLVAPPKLIYVPATPATPAASVAPTHTQTSQNFDLCDLVVPNRIVKSKLEEVAETMGALSLSPNAKQNPTQPKSSPMSLGAPPSMTELQLPQNMATLKSQLDNSFIEEL